MSNAGGGGEYAIEDCLRLEDCIRLSYSPWIATGLVTAEEMRMKLRAAPGHSPRLVVRALTAGEMMTGE